MLFRLYPVFAGCLLLSGLSSLPARQPEEPVSFTMADILEEEAESAKKLTQQLNELGEELRGSHSRGDTGVPYVRDWLDWVALRDWAEGHSRWESDIEANLDIAPPSPPEDELTAWLAVERSRREEAVRIAAAERERELIERRESIRLRMEELFAARTVANLNQEELRRRIEVFNQRTEFRHARAIQRRIDLGLPPFPTNLEGAFRKARIVP